MNSENTKIKWIFGTAFTVVALGFLAAIGSFFLKNITYDYDKTLQTASANEAALAAGAQTAPQYFYFKKEPTMQPRVSALAYFVGDLDTGEIIVTKNKDQKLPIASVSKLMTALVTTELTKPEDLTEVTKSALATEGGNGGFKAGEKVKISDLLYPLLLQSSNDAAEILAEHLGRDIFIEKMNKAASQLQMPGTFFEDPSGLSAKNQSTVADLFRLSEYLNKKNKEILEITKTRNYSNKKHNWPSSNQFLKEEGYLGGKSGYTDPALETVISLFSIPLGESGTRNVAIVLLHSRDRFQDVENILKYLKKNIYYGQEADANMAWVKQKDGIPEPREPNFLTLAFMGDIMLDRGVKNSVLKNFAGDYSVLFEKPDLAKLLKKSDIAFANLEGPASDKGRDQHNLYSFRMDPTIVPALYGAGIDVISVANNHVGDFGREAYEDTLARLKENEILYTGGGMNDTEAETPQIIEKYGMKIGFLAFSDQGPNWMRAKEDQAGLLLASNPRFEEIIKGASAQVDYLVVSFHFGEEYETKHNERQEYLAHKAVDAGARIIIGHHPHVIQDTEIYSPKDCTQSSCMGFIAYSLGNFIFDQGFSADTMEGMILEMRLGKDDSISTTKNIVKLNPVFQPDTIIKGKEEKLKSAEVLLP